MDAVSSEWINTHCDVTSVVWYGLNECCFIGDVVVGGACIVIVPYTYA